MKDLVLITTVAVVCFAAGCQKEQTQPTVQEQVQGFKRGIPIVIADGSEFPSYLAGVWRQEGVILREFIISQDGRIPSVVLGMGMVRVSPDKETRVSLIDGSEGFFVPGVWTASYNPATRVLQISIEMSSFRMQNGPEVLEGVIRETFEGPISDDGEKWQVHYFALPEYHAFTDDGKHHVLMDGSEPDEQELVFNRIYSPFDPESSSWVSED